MHTAGTGLWGHLGGWLHTVFLLRTLAEGVRWDQGLPGGLDAFASGDSGGTPWSEQGATGPSRSKGPTFYHGHHFRSSLGTFGGNGSGKMFKAFKHDNSSKDVDWSTKRIIHITS